MADEPVTGAPGGGAPAAGGGAAPAAPSTPAPAAPSTPSTPAAATPEAPATPTAPAAITRNPGESADEFMARYRAQAEAKTGDEKPAEPAKPSEPAAAEPAKPAAEVPKPEGEKPAEPEAPAEPTQSKLAETIFSNEKLAAALEEAGLKDELADELRTAARGREYGELFADVETAQFARQQAEMFTAADLAASELKIGDIGSTRDFVQKVLMPMSYILKEDGTPDMVEVDDGRGGKVQVPRTDGTVDVLLSNLGDLYVDRALFDANQMLEYVKAHPDDARSEDLKEKAEMLMGAADILRNHHKGPQPVDDDKLPPEVKEERARINADKQALAEEKSREASERFTNFRNDVVGESDKALNTMVESWIDQTSLAPNPADSEQTKSSKDFLRKSISAQIRNGLYEKLNADKLFIGEQEQKGRRGATALKDLVNTYRRYAEKYIYGVAHPILTAAGHERVRQSQARSSKIAAQQDATRVDARAGASPAKPQTPQLDERQVMRDVAVDLQKSLGRPASDDEKVTEWRKRITALKARSVAAV